MWRRRIAKVGCLPLIVWWLYGIPGYLNDGRTWIGWGKALIADTPVTMALGLLALCSLSVILWDSLGLRLRSARLTREEEAQWIREFEVAISDCSEALERNANTMSRISRRLVMATLPWNAQDPDRVVFLVLRTKLETLSGMARRMGIATPTVPRRNTPAFVQEWRDYFTVTRTLIPLGRIDEIRRQVRRPGLFQRFIARQGRT